MSETKPFLNSSNTDIHDIIIEEYTEPDLFSEKKTQMVPGGTGNYVQAFFNILNTSVGAGLLALPFAFRSGLVLGPLLLLFVCVLAVFNYSFMLYVTEKTQKFSYKEIAIVAFNKYVGTIFELTNFLFNFGALVGYTVVIGQLGYPLAIQLLKYIGARVPPIELFLFIIVSCILLPLCCLRHISILSYTSSLSMMSALYSIFAVGFRCFEKMYYQEIKWENVKFFETNFVRVFFAIPILFFAYGGVVTMLPSYKDLKNRKIGKMSIVLVLQIFSAATLYFSMGFVGYLLFQGDTQDNILKNFTDDSDYLILLAKFSILLVIILSFPVVHFITRESIEGIFFANWDFSYFRWIIEAILLTGIGYLLAVFIPNITVVFGLTGGTCGSLVIFVYPGILFAKTVPNIFGKILGIFSAIFCGFLGLICTIAIVLDSFNIIDSN
eukprot:gene7079-11242_t